MGENPKFTCSGNCLNCSPAQRAYCASQHAYSNMKVLDAMMQEVLSLKSDISTLSDKLEAMRNSDEVFDPNLVPKSVSGANGDNPNNTIAQSGDGAGK